MKKLILLSLLPLSLAAQASSLTELEIKWLSAGKPVLEYARAIKLPLDIIVQPQQAPGQVPLALGFENGRCKLVFSMRGNDDAETTLKDVPEADHALMIEAMTAHEIGHCWRYANGTWHSLPAGFVESGEERGRAELLAASREMRETRREEGFADLVALAWTRRAHPEHYGRVFAWLERMRADPVVPRSHHDTRAWVKLAKDGDVFRQAATPFDAARGPWNEGLVSEE
jgi:ADP-ribose pyrophosphatase YjhB (NUDIX family)